ncbi:hypothetical protein YC2023_120747 [Brassica napus]
MESGIQAPPPLSLLQNINSVVSGSPSALMDSNNGSSVVANSLSLPRSSLPLSWSLSMPSTLSSSALLTVGTSQDRTLVLEFKKHLQLQNIMSRLVLKMIAVLRLSLDLSLTVPSQLSRSSRKL